MKDLKKKEDDNKILNGKTMHTPQRNNIKFKKLICNNAIGGKITFKGHSLAKFQFILERNIIN